MFDSNTFKMNGNGSGLLDEDRDVLSSFIPPTDEALAVARPADIDKFYIENEYEEAEEEQRKAYEAKAEEEAREPEAITAETEHAAKQAKHVSARLDAQADQGRKGLETEEEVLGPYTKRPTDGKWTYWGTRGLIVGGEIAGFTGAALLLGEKEIYAVLQAVSVAVSAITLGGIGREQRHLMAAGERQKSPDNLSKKEKPFASWFAGPNKAASYVKIGILACLTGILLIAGGIFALRSVAEGLGPGIAFGAFALALGLASFYNSFAYGDEVADHLDSQRAEQAKKDRKAEEAGSNPVIARHERAKSEAATIRARCHAEGEAAAGSIRRQLYHVLNNSQGVAGNGTAAASPEKA